MARRTMPPEKKRADLSAEQMRKGIKLIERRMAELNAFDLGTITDKYHHPELDSLGRSIDDTLVNIFGPDSIEYTRYRHAASFYTGPTIMGAPPIPAPQVRQHVKQSIESNLATLGSAMKSLHERLEDDGTDQRLEVAPAPAELNNKVFIVHGHDTAPKEAIARFLERIGFSPVILHEQPNKGQTIIEKFEDNSDVGFAVIVLTPDDECMDDQGPTKRARQNVILELGYFIGKLSRAKVCAVRVGDVEIPSDILGVVWTDFDAAGGWRQKLAAELAAAGHAIDWNKVMKGPA